MEGILWALGPPPEVQAPPQHDTNETSLVGSSRASDLSAEHGHPRKHRRTRPGRPNNTRRAAERRAQAARPAQAEHAEQTSRLQLSSLQMVTIERERESRTQRRRRMRQNCSARHEQVSTDSDFATQLQQQLNQQPRRLRTRTTVTNVDAEPRRECPRLEDSMPMVQALQPSAGCEPTVVDVSTTPTIVRVGKEHGRHPAVVMAVLVPGLGRRIRRATADACWVPGLSLNGRDNQWASEKFLHFLATSEPSLQGTSIGGRKGACSGTFMFPTTKWSPALQEVVQEATATVASCTTQPLTPPNLVMGRLYATTGTWRHRQHTDGATASNPDRRYEPDTPVLSIGTAQAPISVWISQTPASTDIKDGPSVLLKFDEGNADDAHVWAMVSLGQDQGALRVRHEVRVHASQSRTPRVALVCRSMAQWDPTTPQLHDLQQVPWLANAMRCLMDQPAKAIQRDLLEGTLGNERTSRLRELLTHPDTFGWPILPQTRLYAALATATLNGCHGEGAVLSAQPQLLKHFGYHTSNKGLAIGAIKVEGRWAASSLLLDFTKWVMGPGGTLHGDTRYANRLWPAPQPTSILCQGPDAAAAAEFRAILQHSQECQVPVRILIKFDASEPPPLQHCGVGKRRRVLALCLAHVTECHEDSYLLTRCDSI